MPVPKGNRKRKKEITNPAILVNLKDVKGFTAGAVFINPKDAELLKLAKDEDRFETIIQDISLGISAIRAIKKIEMSSATFYELLKDEDRKNKYARACEIRAGLIFDEMTEICDATENDIIIDHETGKEITNHNVINRDRLRVDTRKWILSKMNPKKYGDKLEVDAHTENITSIQLIQSDGRVYGEISSSEDEVLKKELPDVS
jgi:hypothetical protein